MKKTIVLAALLALTCAAEAQWQPAGNLIKTKWAEEINPDAVLPEYPRPLVERTDWANLNGLWEYAITSTEAAAPEDYAGKILVPFAIESSLSGVQQRVNEKQSLWYRRYFDIPKQWAKRNVILNFGAVDWKAEVYVNDIFIGCHTGGYTPFSFDITPYLDGQKNQKLVVKVTDTTDKSYQPRGKQTLKPEGIWYTAVTGIWQTVWMEPVNVNHITAVKTIPQLDRNALAVTVNTSSAAPGDIITVDVFDNGTKVATAKGVQGNELNVVIPSPKLWNTENPFLYDMKISLVNNKKVVDEITSYAAMRKISCGKDSKGVMRMKLNNQPLFQFGPLDQGWWPDGLYTAPTDEALAYDIIKTKDFGFNMIRKHVKVEPARWYYHCDRLGMLVWQDMPSGDMGNTQWQPNVYNGGVDKKRSQASADNFYKEWREIMDAFMSYPCIVAWVPFNEAWGQFDTVNAVEWTVAYDRSRIVNPASGGNHRPCGHILDIHTYPSPQITVYDPARVNVIGEYGGIGMPVAEHLWQQNRNWGYVKFDSSKAVTDEYAAYAEKLKECIKQGIGAAVYTQTTDVEGEVNGLMTYDRKVIKIDEDAMRRINTAVIEAAK